jgi:hypothetical protein
MLPLALLALPVLQAPAPPVQPFAGLAFLEGRWVGEGGPDGSSGEFSLEKSLGGKILLRKNTARMPGPDGKTAVHEDLMVIFSEAETLRAEYFDNEGHVIRYAIETAPGRAAFLSSGPGPRFRLTYLQTAEDAVEIRFEVAPPDKPEQFRLYLSGKAKRLKS